MRKGVKSLNLSILPLGLGLKLPFPLCHVFILFDLVHPYSPLSLSHHRRATSFCSYILPPPHLHHQ